MKRKRKPLAALQHCLLLSAFAGTVLLYFLVKQTEHFGAYEVLRVVDGDTIIVSIEGSETTVRLIGVDAPESVHPDSSRNSESGKIASEFTAELLTGKQVYLEYDRERTDSYGRTLAYVWLDHKMVEETLLENGMATVLTIQPNTRYAARFVQIEQQAKEGDIGIWSKFGLNRS